MARKTIGRTKTAALISAAVVLAAICAIPCGAAFAADTAYPGVRNYVDEYGDTQPGESETATTTIGLKINNAQISFKAPLVINFAMEHDGDFIYPTQGEEGAKYQNVAVLENTSVFDIYVSKFDVACADGLNGQTKEYFDSHDSADISNVYKLQVAPCIWNAVNDVWGDAGDAVDFAVSATSLSEAQWTMAKGTESSTTAGTVTGGGKIGLTFSDGKMKNITKSFATGQTIQTVTWYVAPSNGTA